MSAATIRRQHKRPRPQSSCSVCHKRKVKCSRTLPCLQCQKHGCADECKFDGLQPLNSESTSATSTTQEPNDDQAVTEESSTELQAPRSDLHTLLERADATRKEIQAIIDTGEVTTRKESRYATHDWIWSPKYGSLRGRTHSPGIVQHFDPLMIYVERSTLSDRHNEDDAGRKRKRTSTNLADYTAASIYEDMRPLNSSMELILRYFDTWHTLFPLIDRMSFEQSYGAMLIDPQTATICSMLETLLVMALANATYAPENARVCPDKVSRWLDLASRLPETVIESGELHIRSVRLMALLNLAEQVLCSDITANYIRSGDCVRAAMSLSLHRSERAEDHAAGANPNEHSLWTTIVELDQHACLAAGMPPAVPRQEETVLPKGEQVDVPNDLDQASLRRLLARSLPIRHKILASLNNEKHLMFEQTVELSTALTKAFAPVSTCQDIPADLRTFQYEYIFFVYRSFMSALHRIFFAMDGEPAFYISRGMAIRLARRHMREVSPVWRGDEGISAFAALLASDGAMFRSETRHAIMVVALELYRDEDVVQTTLLSVEGGRAALFDTFKSFFGFMEQKVKLNNVPERFFLIPAMVYAHMQISARHKLHSSEYCRAMAEAGSEAEKCLGNR